MVLHYYLKASQSHDLPFLSKQRHLADALGAVVLVGAGVGGEAVLAGGDIGLGGGKDDALHGGEVLLYLPVLLLEGGGEFLFDEAAVGVGIYDAEGVYLAAMRDDVVLVHFNLAGRQQHRT